MKVIGISGSPRAGGNTYALLRYTLNRIKACGFPIEIIEISGRNIQACRGCDICRENQTCAIDDDLRPIFKKMLLAEGIIIGTPVYTGTMPGILKALLERTSYLCYTTGRSFERKIGAPIVVAGRAGQNFTHAELLMWYHVNGFYMVGSNYWNIAFGLNRGDVEKDSMAYSTLNSLADNFVNLLHLMKKKRKSFV